jgi:hypothetical protein
MAELTLLSEIQSPDLINYNVSDIISEIINRIQKHPEWNQLWNGELRQSALYVIINIFAYLFSKNAEVANRLIKENFILLAKDPNNITNIMANYGLRIRSNTHSVANIQATRTDGGSLTSDLVISGTPGSPFAITATGAVGTDIIFEIYEKDEYGKIDYYKPVILRKGLVNNIFAYSGQTHLETVEIDTQDKKEKFYYTLKNSPVIEDSIRVYYFFDEQKLELAETDSFTMPATGDTNRFPGGQPYYKIVYSEAGVASIVFGTQFFGGSFPKNEIGQLQIFYRSGGGAASNVTAGSISFIGEVSNISLTFTNNGDSGGGVDVEDLDLAKFYAPMRVGRGKQIVDDRDALLALAGMTVKHKIISPQYSFLPNKDSVPILHYYNYVVPPRNFTQFTLPTPATSDTVSTYEYKMRAALNEFLNLSKLHDGIITDEAIASEYTENNLQYALRYKPILSGTLSVSAYDHYGTEIDRLIYSSSYFGETNINDTNTSTAKLKSYSRITETVFNLNDRNEFHFEMDGYLLQIAIPNQINGVNIQYSTPTALAEKVNELIIQVIKNSWTTDEPLLLIPAGQNYITLNYNYFYYDNGYFYLNSPTIGANSSLKIFNDSGDTKRKRFLTLIKFIGSSSRDLLFTYAVPESRKIFLDNSNFNYVNNSLDVKLNLSDIDRTLTLNDMISWPNRDLPDGPFLSYEIRDENLKNIFLKQNTNLVMEIYDEYDVLKDRIIYENVAFGQVTPGNRVETDKDGNTIQGQLEIFKDPDLDFNGVYSITYFDYANSKIYFALANSDDEQLSAPYSFPRQSFINNLLENSISDAWLQYDDGIEASLPVDGFGKKFNFISNNFILFPSPDPLTGQNQIPTGWQYYYDTYDQIETILVEEEDPDPANWYYDTISYEEKTLVPRVDENGDPVLDENGEQIIDEVWLPYATTIYLKSLYDQIVLDTENYRNIVVGSLIKPIIQVPTEVVTVLPSPEVVDGVGNSNSVTNKLVLIKDIVIENNVQNPKYLFEKKAENSLGCGISYGFQIDEANTNSQLKFKFVYSIFSDDEYTSEFVDGDIITYIIAENQDKTVVFEDATILSIENSFEVIFNSINFTNYRLVFHVPNNKTNRYKIYIDDIQIYQEPIDTAYLLEIISDGLDSLTLYKPETNIAQQVVRGQGVAFDVGLTANSIANFNMQYAIDDGTYNDIVGVSIIGMKLINNAYTYTLLDLNDNYDTSTTLTSKMINVLLDNDNNNKISFSFNTGDYTRFRIVFHARSNQSQSFQISFSNIQIGMKPADIYNENFYFKVYYSREKFDTIKCSYEPHPYFQEDESMGFLDILRNQNKRIIGVEPILKKVNFNPMGISLFLTFTSTGKVEEVLNRVEPLVIDNFSYNNTNENIKIGEIFSLDLVGQKLVENLVSYGLVGAKVTDVNSLVAENPTSDDYFFIAPPILYESLLALEAEYPNVVGIADKYNIKVTYLKL